MTIDPEALLNLSIEERIELMSRVWDSVNAEPARAPSDGDTADARLAAELRPHVASFPWRELRGEHLATPRAPVCLPEWVDLDAILRLGPGARLDLVDLLWNSIGADPDEEPLSEEEILREMEAEIEEDLRAPETSIPWSEFRARLLGHG